MRNNVPKPPSAASLHTLSKLYVVPVGFVTLPPRFWKSLALFAIAEKWLLHDIG